MSAYAPVSTRQSFPELEQRVLERWRETGLFERTLEAREGEPVWSFYEGPPTANGRPGSHHVLSRVFKDVYPRYRTMRGFRVPRKAGWDCHGLPVELEVEKELGISSKEEIEELGIAEFNARCRESVFRYVAEWDRLTERIGFWLDLDDPYVTMTSDYIESVWWSLRQIWDQGRLYEGHKVVPYCPRCGTALSSHEVAQGYRDVTDPSVYVELSVTDPAATPLKAGDRLLVWTTTPWTLISHAAVAAGPELAYVRARPAGAAPDAPGGVYVVAEALVERVLGEGAEVISRHKGAELEGARYEAPFDYVPGESFGPHGHTVLNAGFVTTEDGTGLVHTALAFGEDDFRLGEAYGMTLQNPVRADGTYDERVPDFQGKLVYEHNPEIVEALERAGRLFRAEEYEHAYPHCWRCGTALLYYAKSSWYIRTTDVREQLLAANETIGWHPEHVKHGRFGKWLENNVDWALSRERYWGTPLPVWRCTADDCDEAFCAGSLEDIRERGGEVPEDLHRPYIDEVALECERCGGEMRRVSEVIDTWYDSGAMPFAQLHYPFEGKEEFAERFPADFISEAQDQTRGWFYSLLAESVLLFGESSYRNCVCLGLILDPEGQKMSKSRGNVVDPWEVIDSHGADAFRWYYLTAQQPWAGYRFSADAVGESVRQFLLTLWNTYSFWVLYANAEGVDAADPPKAPDAEALAGDESPAAKLDRWALSRLEATRSEVIALMDAYDCTSAGRAIAAFVDELSNWYVRLQRRRFWEGDRAALGTLRHCLLEVAKLAAPFVPFVCDEIWRNLAAGEAGTLGDGTDSVHLVRIADADPERRDEQLEQAVGATFRAIELGRAARAAAGVKMRQPLRAAVVVAQGGEREAIESLAGVVRGELNVREVEFVREESELASYRPVPNFRALGPRFGKQMPQAKAAIEALDPDAVAAAIRGEGEVGITIEGTAHTLGPEDVALQMEPLEGYEVEAQAGRAVALATELDESLVREGLAREIVHAVQGARKDAGLEVTDRIELALSGDDELIAAAREHSDYVSGETLASGLGEEIDGAESTSTATIEGRALQIGLSRAPG